MKETSRQELSKYKILPFNIYNEAGELILKAGDALSIGKILQLKVYDKIFRDTSPTEENITILQDINTILDQKMKCTNTNQNLIINQQQEKQDEDLSKSTNQQSKTQNDTNQVDSTKAILSTEKIECSQDLSEDTIDFKLVLSSIQHNNQDQQVDLFDDTDDDDTINISPVFIKNANDLVIEEGESKPFQNDIFKSLEFKPMKIRRKLSLEMKECSKRQHLSSN